MMPECSKIGNTEASRRREGRCQSHAGEAAAKVWHGEASNCIEEPRYHRVFVRQGSEKARGGAGRSTD